jgi:hypothetical protein
MGYVAGRESSDGSSIDSQSAFGRTMLTEVTLNSICGGSTFEMASYQLIRLFVYLFNLLPIKVVEFALRYPSDI